MFSKLLKHEWRSSRATMLALCLSIPVAAVAAGFLMRFFISTASYETEDLFLGMVSVASIFSMVFMIFAMVGCAAAAYIILLVRFYRSRFTDEGYLTFTLPVKTSHILLAPVVNMILWNVILTVTLVVSVVLMILVGAAGTELLTIDPFYYGFETDSSLLILPMQMLSSLIYAPMVATGSITLGCTLAKKHRALASFGIFYGISMVVSILTGILQLFLSAGLDIAQVYDNAYLWITGLAGIVIQLGISVGSWFLSLHLMKHKLNLP